MNTVLILFSAISFFAYGLACFVSPYLKREFIRYGMDALRPLVGSLQIAAAMGLVGGLSQPWMGSAAATGLAAMMLVAVWVRIRIKDSLLQTTPALCYLVLNAYLGWAAF
ncbi:MAG: DoxX family protein [Terrimicrobiaceae bacterium]